MCKLVNVRMKNFLYRLLFFPKESVGHLYYLNDAILFTEEPQ